MSLDEGAPRHTLAPLRGRRDTVLGEGPLDGVASEFISEVLECALQARISPCQVLPRHTYHELTDVLRRGRSAWTPVLGAIVLGCDEVAVPTWLTTCERRTVCSEPGSGQTSQAAFRSCIERLCIVKTAPPTKSRTYAPLEFRAEDGETPPLCSTLLSSSSHLASVSFGRCVGAAPTWCWRTSLCGSK